MSLSSGETFAALTEGDAVLAEGHDGRDLHRRPRERSPFAEATRSGWVKVNAPTDLWEPQLPFGGRAGSVGGRGRVGGRHVLDAFTEQKTVLFPTPGRLLP